MSDEEKTALRPSSPGSSDPGEEKQAGRDIDLPAEARALAAELGLKPEDPMLVLFASIAAQRAGAFRELRAAVQAHQRLVEAQGKLLSEKAGAAQEIIERAAKQASAVAARKVRQQGGRTLAAVDREVQKQLAQALREAAALDRRTWRDKFLPPLAAGAAAGVVLAVLVGAGWWLWAGPISEQAEAYQSVQAAYSRLTAEQRRQVDEILWGGAEQ